MTAASMDLIKEKPAEFCGLPLRIVLCQDNGRGETGGKTYGET